MGGIIKPDTIRLTQNLIPLSDSEWLIKMVTSYYYPTYTSPDSIIIMNKVFGILLVATLFSFGTTFPITTFANERFIPIELWLGGNITTSRKLSFPEVDFEFGYKERHKIKGPINWENSKTRENIRVYVRSRFSKKLNKEISQLWTYTNNNQCLGRVFDNRGNRVIENGCKFPIGLWKEGESRSFSSNYYDEKK